MSVDIRPFYDIDFLSKKSFLTDQGTIAVFRDYTKRKHSGWSYGGANAEMLLNPRLHQTVNYHALKLEHPSVLMEDLVGLFADKTVVLADLEHFDVIKYALKRDHSPYCVEH